MVFHCHHWTATAVTTLIQGTLWFWALSSSLMTPEFSSDYSNTAGNYVNANPLPNCVMSYPTISVERHYSPTVILDSPWAVSCLPDHQCSLTRNAKMKIHTWWSCSKVHWNFWCPTTSTQDHSLLYSTGHLGTCLVGQKIITREPWNVSAK